MAWPMFIMKLNLLCIIIAVPTGVASLHDQSPHVLVKRDSNQGAPQGAPQGLEGTGAQLEDLETIVREGSAALENTNLNLEFTKRYNNFNDLYQRKIKRMSPNARMCVPKRKQ
ncbi:hypothetical protein DSO57_1038497 [Entomophthora muscae]|uniref:Uncharacterized protein n=1 Tax=Entomophthora muscae TaxID=34485 RepID=A0ACC2T9H5_9FUNG|nr:hypothetical protein DSO57_1038497 [Entomophthora muscae]